MQENQSSRLKPVTQQLAASAAELFYLAADLEQASPPAALLVRSAAQVIEGVQANMQASGGNTIGDERRFSPVDRFEAVIGLT